MNAVTVADMVIIRPVLSVVKIDVAGSPRAEAKWPADT
jgi:hypothetical protein